MMRRTVINHLAFIIFTRKNAAFAADGVWIRMTLYGDRILIVESFIIFTEIARQD